MKKKVLLVEDQFVEANDLQLMLEKAGYEVSGIARSVVIAQQMIKNERPDLVLLDIFLKGKLTGIDLARQLRQDNIAFIYLSANSNEEILSQAKTTEPDGFIVKPFREKDLLVTLEIAEYRHEHSTESRARREINLLRHLEDVIKGGAGPAERLLQAARIMQQDIPFDCLTILFTDSIRIPGNVISFLRVGFDEHQTLSAKDLSRTVRVAPEELAELVTACNNDMEPVYHNSDDFIFRARQASLQKVMQKFLGMNSMLSFPATMKDEGACTLCFFSRRPDTYTSDHISLLRRLERSLVSEKGQKCEVDPLTARAVYNRKAESSRVSHEGKLHSADFEGIVGNSHLLLNVFDQIGQVAPFDTSVLVLGETGTGKERIADCIHNLSPRKGKSFVKVNCAALPATLIESELFGHERGAFTGASDKRTGKFEQANGGTIFLDEIGEMPIDMQVKLLRVLQEKEIEPLGAKSSVKIDVRVIAATNRNLEKEVGEGRFRMDLYYRLNVFPITLPSLRERIEDIPALAQHFINIYSRKSGKQIRGLSDKVIKNLMTYNWPGNIRELEHLIERSILIAKGDLIEDVTLPPQNKPGSPIPSGFQIKSIHDNERDHIIEVLKKCNGRIWGAGGAAEALNVPPSTLQSKMKKLGILKKNIQ